jgi:hypothetical protein
MVTEEKIKDLGEKADELADEIHQLEEAVDKEEKEGEKVPEGVVESEGDELEAGLPEGEGQELKLEEIFNDEEMGEKAAALANEGDPGGTDFFAPSAAAEMEASLEEGDGMGTISDMFNRQGSDDDPLAALMTVKSAAEVAGISVVPSYTGEAAKHFEQNEAAKETRNTSSDHEDDLWAEVIPDGKPEEQGAKRTPQDATNELKPPKEASAKEGEKKAAAPAAPPTLKKIKPVIASDKEPPRIDVASALFADDFEG